MRQRCRGTFWYLYPWFLKDIRFYEKIWENTWFWKSSIKPVKSRLETIWEDIRDYDKSTFHLPRQYLNNTRIERMCLLMDKTDYQIPGTLEFGNLFWSFATFKNTAGRSEVLPGATKKENRESTLNDFPQLLLALHKMLWYTQDYMKQTMFSCKYLLLAHQAYWLSPYGQAGQLPIAVRDRIIDLVKS